MPLYAILTDDKTAIREIRDFPEGTVFKPGFAFPVTVEDKPAFDQDTQTLERNVAMPNKGTVVISWTVVSLPQEQLDAKAKQAEVEGYFASLKTLREKITNAGKLEPAEQTELFGYLIDILIAKENSKL